jgi:hypothetical protein
MIILSSTTDSLAITTENGASYDLDVVATYIDRVTSTGVVGAADRNLVNIVTATTVDVVEEPASDTTRNVKTLSVRNVHATSSVDVFVKIDANGTFYELFKCSLLAGEQLYYLEKVGFFKLVDTVRSERIFIMTGDMTISSNAAFADIPGLQCPMKAGIAYGVFAFLHHNQTATTNGARFAYNIGAAPTDAIFSNIDTVTGSVTAAAFSSGSATARDTAITAQTTGSLTTVVPCLLGGFIIPSADGTFSLRANEENDTVSGMLVKAGSWMRVFRATG